MVSMGRAGGGVPGARGPAGGCVVAAPLRVLAFPPRVVPLLARSRMWGVSLVACWAQAVHSLSPVCASEVASDATVQKRRASTRSGE